MSLYVDSSALLKLYFEEPDCALPIVTLDLRQAQAARSLGWVVLGR